MSYADSPPVSKTSLFNLSQFYLTLIAVLKWLSQKSLHNWLTLCHCSFGFYDFIFFTSYLRPLLASLFQGSASSVYYWHTEILPHSIIVFSYSTFSPSSFPTLPQPFQMASKSKFSDLISPWLPVLKSKHPKLKFVLFSPTLSSSYYLLT